jgi:hypothetical protein
LDIFLFLICIVIGGTISRFTVDELNQAIKSNSYDIVSYFIQEDNAPTDNSYMLFGEGRLNPVIRFSNHPESTK